MTKRANAPMAGKPHSAYCIAMHVGEIMKPGTFCVGSGASLVEAGTLMRQFDVSVVPVCENQRLMGIITDRDIAMRAVIDQREPRHTPVRDAMTHGVVFVYDDDDVREAVQRMSEHHVRQLPVLNRDRRIVGVVSDEDVEAAGLTPAFPSSDDAPAGLRISER